MKRPYFQQLIFLSLVAVLVVVGVKSMKTGRGQKAPAQISADKPDPQLRPILSAIGTISRRVTEPKVVSTQRHKPVQTEMVVYGNVPLPAEEPISAQSEPPHYYAPSSPALPYENSWSDKGYRTVRPELKVSRGNRVTQRKRPRVGTYQIPGGSVTIRPIAYYRHRSYGQQHYRSRGYRSYRAPYRPMCQYWVYGRVVYAPYRHWVPAHYVSCACR